MRDNKLIQMYITNMCNSHCKTCSIWQTKQENCKQLYAHDIGKVLDAFPDADYVIGGGEALMHPQMGSILELLKLRNTKYTLLSNCIAIDRLIDLVTWYHVPAVTISFDGIQHDEHRGSSGNLAKILTFIKYCEMVDTTVKLSYTLSSLNEKTFIQDMKFIRDVIEMNSIYFCLAQPMTLLKTQFCDSDFEPVDIEQILNVKMIPEKDRRHVRSMTTGVRKPCDSQTSVHTIYSDGDIVRCQSFKSGDVLGNIKKMSVDEIRELLNNVEKIDCPYDAECNLLCQRRYD